MSLRTGTWIIAAGTLVLFLALCCLPAALGNGQENDLLPAASGLFALGGILVSFGIYSKARFWRATIKPDEANTNAQSRRARGGCDLCGTEAPVIQCTVHELHLCGNCLANHYDVRSCAYVPTTKSGRAMGKSAGRG